MCCGFGSFPSTKGIVVCTGLGYVKVDWFPVTLYVDWNWGGLFNHRSAVFRHRLIVYSIKSILVFLSLRVELSFLNEIGRYKIAQVFGIDQDPGSYISYFGRYH